MLNVVYGIWVVAKYEGTKAKGVLAQADAGIGYLALDRSNNSCVVAFVYVKPGPVPNHLEVVADPFKVARYQKMFAERQAR